MISRLSFRGWSKRLSELRGKCVLVYSSPCTESLRFNGAVCMQRIQSVRLLSSITGARLLDVEEFIAAEERSAGGRNAEFSAVLQYTSIVFGAPSFDGRRKKLLLDRLLQLMAQSRLSHVLDASKTTSELIGPIADLERFYRQAREENYLCRTLRPLSGRLLRALQNDVTVAGTTALLPAMRVIYGFRLYRNREIAVELHQAKPQLLVHIQQVPDGDRFILPLMQLVYVAGRVHVEHQAPCGLLIDAGLSRLADLLTPAMFLKQPSPLVHHLVPLLCSVIQTTGHRHEAFFENLAGNLIRRLHEFPQAQSWWAWAHCVLHCYGRLGFQAEKLAHHVCSLLERSLAWDVHVVKDGPVVVQLSWSFICQGVMPPAILLDTLCVTVESFVLGKADLGPSVLRLPQLLPFLPAPWSHDKRLISLIGQHAARFTRPEVGHRLKGAFPDLLVNMLFPHEGLVAALGVFDAETGKLVPYPHSLPDPTEIEDGVLTSMLACRLVAFIDLGWGMTLVPRTLVSGYAQRQQWLLERKGWHVCMADGENLEPNAICKIMQTKARLHKLRSAESMR